MSTESSNTTESSELCGICWDKLMTARLIEIGLDFNSAREIVGIIADERMNADRIGYFRGFNNGYKEGQSEARLLVPKALKSFARPEEG